MEEYILLTAILGGCQFYLDTVDPIDAVDKQYQDEDEGNLYPSAIVPFACLIPRLTFMPYCNFAIRGFSEMKVKSLRFQVNGRGTMSPMKMDISTTKRTNTYRQQTSA